MTARIAIIAGAGQFPFHVAREAQRRGIDVVAIGLRDWVDCSLSKTVPVYEEIGVGELGKLIHRLKEHGVREAIMAGKVTKGIIFDPRVLFDGETLKILHGVKDYSVGGLLGAVGARLAEEGITLLDSSTYLRDYLCPDSVLTKRKPSAVEQEDIRFGVQIARALAAVDVGQTVIVKSRVVVAVEALEGTDAAIRRAHDLAGDKLVVVKTAALKQDRRFDLPVIGMDTVKILQENGVSCIAIEAGSTLLLDRAVLIETADRADICITGVSIPNPS